MAICLDNHSRARAAIIFLWIAAGLSAAGLIYNLLGVHVLQSRRAAIIGIILVGALSLATIVSFLAWFYRAYRNLDSTGVYMLYAPGWAIGSFLVPFMNWIRPYRIMEEIWRENTEMVNDPNAAEPLTKNQPNALLKWWWGCWVLADIAGIFYTPKPALSDPVGLLAPTHNLLANVSLLLSIVAAILAIQVIQKISTLESKVLARQRARESSAVMPHFQASNRSIT